MLLPFGFWSGLFWLVVFCCSSAGTFLSSAVAAGGGDPLKTSGLLSLRSTGTRRWFVGYSLNRCRRLVCVVVPVSFCDDCRNTKHVFFFFQFREWTQQLLQRNNRRSAENLQALVLLLFNTVPPWICVVPGSSV